MNLDQLIADLTVTRRRQRIALLVALSPFYVLFALGWMWRVPMALFAGAIGLAIVVGAYKAYAPKHPPTEPKITPEAGDDE
jgi:alpha-beta hydrolase superfamily lysophospholipase